MAFLRDVADQSEANRMPAKNLGLMFGMHLLKAPMSMLRESSPALLNEIKNLRENQCRVTERIVELWPSIAAHPSLRETPLPDAPFTQGGRGPTPARPGKGVSREASMGPSGVREGVHRERCRALFSFEPEGTRELSMREGDVFYVIRKDSSGWWKAERAVGGKKGWIPATYVQLIVD
ncbi:hypothetical protein KIPB_000028 [Kipferlia bialata]|uniref:SH3 domain-containing protein n=1 Tax=Kipferlia bialata TaxID=797122 RepID=A0A9K3CNC2_9EUKA|nr:hypothetical protein KIPB_000028 [Kipferlia bialata]|eukprot:g28.t1